MAAHKLDIFETLAAVDRRNTGFYAGLSEDEKKGFAPPVVLRWASGVNDGAASEHYIWLTNERANINFWEIADHPELQYKLLASCGIGSNQRHKWIPMAGKKRKSDRVREFLSTFWPDANDRELDILFHKFTEEEFEDFVKFSGCDPEEEKEVLDEYAKLIGKKVTKKRKK